MILFNFKLAFRNLVKNRVYSILIIGGFAIGFAACILIGLYYHAEATVNTSFTNHKQIYRLYDVKRNRCNMNWELFPTLGSDYAAIENACPLDYQDIEHTTIKDIQTNNLVEIRYLLATTSNFFSIFSVKTPESLSGSPFEGKESFAISRTLAKSLFGELNPLGRKINLGNYFTGTVTSLFDELPANTSFKADIILNSANDKFRFSSTISNGKRYNPTNHFILVKKGTSGSLLAEQLNQSAKLQSLDIDSLSLQRLDDIYLSQLTFKNSQAKGNPALLKIFLAIAVLILLLSCINYLNYSVSMQYAAIRNTGIKNSFGADWKSLVSYQIIEVTIGIVVSLILSFYIAATMLSYSDALFGKVLNVKWQDCIAIAPFILTALLLIVVINSLAPLFIISKFSISEFLSGVRVKKHGRQIWKPVLLTFQLTVSIALITIVLVIFRQLSFFRHSDPGFERNLLLRINIPYKYPSTDVLNVELRNLSFVRNTTLSSGCPGMINHKMGSNSGDNSFDMSCIYVGDNYLNTMEMELVGGRNFLSGDLKNSCLINEEALRQYGWESFEGKRFNAGQDEGWEVIGVVKDFKFQSYHKTIQPLALLYDGAQNGNVLSVRLMPGDIGQQIDKIRQIWKSVSPYEAFSYVFYDDFYQAFYNKEAKLASSITFFSMIAIVLTCMGILGQIFMICLTRVKEIGIRKINGARVSEVLLLLNRDFLKWFVIAFFAAAPVSWYISHKWLQNFAYRVDLSWWIFMMGGLIALLILFVTVSWQSWKAATMNPIRALRYE